MGNKHYYDKFHRPEVFSNEILQKGMQGKYREIDENVQVFYRAVVIAVDVIGGKLENPSGNGSVSHTINGKKFDFPANVGPLNPKNSIKARILSDEIDQFTVDDDLRVFWPIMPEHSAVPIKPGEFAYVIFEDKDSHHGMWLSKVSGQEGVNYVSGQGTFVPDDAATLPNLFPDSTDSTTDQPSDSEAGGNLVNQGNLTKLFPDT